MEKSSTKCKNLFRKVDAFGTIISFRFDDDIEYKSVIGGISTITFALITLIYGVYCSYDFFSRKNVEFIFTSKILDKDPFVNLTKSNFNFAFGIQFSDTDKEEETPALTFMKEYFNYNIRIIEWIGVNDLVEYTLGLKQCEKSDFNHLVDEAFDTNLLGALLCPMINGTTNYTVEGAYTDYYYKFIDLEVTLSEEGIKNTDTVKEIMSEFPIEMAVFWLDTAINYENRKNSMPSFINYSYKTLDYDFIKTTTLYLSGLEFKNDENLFWDNTVTIKDAMFDISMDSFRYIEDRGGSEESLIGKFILQASTKVIQVSRKYQKFPSFIAELSSLLQEILVFMFIVVNYVERKAVDHKLIKRMLKYKGSEFYDVNYLLKTFNKANRRPSQVEEIEEPEISEKLTDSIIENKIKKKGKKSIISLPSKKTRELQPMETSTNLTSSKERIKEDIDIQNGHYKQLNICHILYASICFWTTKKQKKINEIISKLERRIHHYLDVFTYIKKMQEIDIIEYSLYDEDQEKLFQFLSKPSVRMGMSNYKEFAKTQMNYPYIGKKEINLLYSSYNNIKKKNPITVKDKKLLKLVKAEVDFLKQ